LVVIPHDTQVPVFGRKLTDDLVLGVVGVLVFVHQDVVQKIFVGSKDIGFFLEKLPGEIEQVVEVQRLGVAEAFLVHPVGLDYLVHEVIPAHLTLFGHVFGFDESVPGAADEVGHTARRQYPGVDVHLGEDLLDDPGGIVVVENGKVAADPQLFDMLAQDPHACRVEG
jgi:hypothetical protein